MRILFICKYNAFRSPIAEKYLKKINKNANEVISEGIIMGGKPDKEQVRLARELLGVDISKRASQPLDLDDLIAADLIIVVADDIPKVIFDYRKDLLLKKVRIWKIKDEQYSNSKNISKIILKIKKKVDKLNEELGEK